MNNLGELVFGIAFLVAGFGGLFYITALMHGWRWAARAWLTALSISGVMTVGFYLVVEGLT